VTANPGDHDTDPVFLDRTGRRHRLVALLTSGGGLALVLTTLALIAGFTGAGPTAVPGWPAATPAHTAQPRPASHPTEHSRAATPSSPPAAAPAARHTGSAAATAPPSASPTTSPSPSPSPSRPGNRGNSAHTRNPHSAKKS
jgi:hypothetical protein